MEPPPRRVRPHGLSRTLSTSFGSLLDLQFVTRKPFSTLKLNACNSPAAGFDLIVATLTVLGVRRFGSGGLAALLRRQGIEYFGLILIVHLVTVVGTGSVRR